MTDEINVISRTQVINVEPTSGAVSIINAGPAGPTGPTGPPLFHSVQIGCSDPNGEELEDGVGIAYYRTSVKVNGGHLAEVYASVSSPTTFGSITIQIRNAAHGWYMLSTPLTIDLGEYDAMTSTPAVINTSSSHHVVATGDQIFVDVIAAGVGAKGLNVELVFVPA